MDNRFSTPEELNKALQPILKTSRAQTQLVPIAGTAKNEPVLYKMEETPENREKRYALMKTVMEHKLPANHFQKAGVTVASNVFGYDLRAPAMLHMPFLSPLRDVTSRVQHSITADAAHWKVINNSTFTPGTFAADPWVNEGARAPRFSFSATTKTAPYVTIGTDGSDTFEAQSAGQGYEDPLSTAQFIGLEKLMVSEENALLGGNSSLKIGTANTPTNTTATSSGATLNTTYYVAVVGLTYSGVQNQSVTAGLVQQLTVTTPDNKQMTTNGGMGIRSSASASQAVTTGNALVSTVVQKAGEMGWAWYVGTSTGTMYLQQITTTPKLTLTSFNNTTQLLSSLTSTDYSVNDGTTGGGVNQVTAFDGFLTQIINASQLGTPNAYYAQLAGAGLTASGRGSITQIDTAIRSAWDNFRISYDRIYVNAQELVNITTGCLTNASGPLVRYEINADGGNYDLTASGTIAFYFSPFINGGSKIPIIVHPTLPAGTILLQGLSLPSFYKKSNMGTTAEVICRRDYYSINWPVVTREYEFGTYSEEVLAMYAPFCYGLITGIGNSVNT